MKKLKPALRNLKFNLPLLGSFLGLLGLALGTEEGILRICLTLFGFLLILSPFFTCGLPLGRGLFSNRKAAVVAVVTEFTMLLQYYKSPALGFLQGIAGQYHVPLQWLTICLGFLLSSVGFYATYVLWVRALALLAPMKGLLRSYKKQLLILCVIFSISLIGIIRANFYYIDDLKRILEDYSLTGAFSRHISSFMAALFHGDSWLADISPLSQLIAACFLSLAAVILYEAISDNRDMGFWGFISLIPVGLFPFFLSCYSFKFDAPYMALSVLAAVAPLAYRRENPL